MCIRSASRSPPAGSCTWPRYSGPPCSCSGRPLAHTSRPRRAEHEPYIPHLLGGPLHGGEDRRLLAEAGAELADLGVEELGPGRDTAEPATRSRRWPGASAPGGSPDPGQPLQQAARTYFLRSRRQTRTSGRADGHTSATASHLVRRPGVWTGHERLRYRRPRCGSKVPAMDDDRRRLDTTRPSSARVYNYWLGGKDHFAADREYGEAVAKTSPNIRTAAIENRRFLGRVVRVLTDAGIRQFLDIGTGLPTAGNTHEVAQRIAPESRTVYVDNDPLVLTHARALLTSHPDGATAYIEADLREPDTILSAAELRDTLDLARPVALMMVAVLHFVPT